MEKLQRAIESLVEIYESNTSTLSPISGLEPTFSEVFQIQESWWSLSTEAQLKMSQLDKFDFLIETLQRLLSSANVVLTSLIDKRLFKAYAHVLDCVMQTELLHTTWSDVLTSTSNAQKVDSFSNDDNDDVSEPNAFGPTGSSVWTTLIGTSTESLPWTHFEQILLKAMEKTLSEKNVRVSMREIRMLRKFLDWDCCGIIERKKFDCFVTPRGLIPSTLEVLQIYFSDSEVSQQEVERDIMSQVRAEAQSTQEKLKFLELRFSEKVAECRALMERVSGTAQDELAQKLLEEEALVPQQIQEACNAYLSSTQLLQQMNDPIRACIHSDTAKWTQELQTAFQINESEQIKDWFMCSYSAKKQRLSTPIPGRLFLTDRHLAFLPCKEIPQKIELPNISLSEVLSIKECDDKNTVGALVDKSLDYLSQKTGVEISTHENQFLFIHFASASHTFDVLFQAWSSLRGNQHLQVHKSGWMMKEGGGVKTWKKRWFELYSDSLVYKSDTQSTSPLGTIPLHSVVKVQPSSRGESWFEVHTLSRTFYFQAPSPEEMEEWMASLQGQANSPTYHRLFFGAFKQNKKGVFQWRIFVFDFRDHLLTNSVDGKIRKQFRFSNIHSSKLDDRNSLHVIVEFKKFSHPYDLFFQNSGEASRFNEVAKKIALNQFTTVFDIAPNLAKPIFFPCKLSKTLSSRPLTTVVLPGQLLTFSPNQKGKHSVASFPLTMIPIAECTVTKVGESGVKLLLEFGGNMKDIVFMFNSLIQRNQFFEIVISKKTEQKTKDSSAPPSSLFTLQQLASSDPTFHTVNFDSIFSPALFAQPGGSGFVDPDGGQSSRASSFFGGRAPSMVVPRSPSEGGTSSIPRSVSTFSARSTGGLQTSSPGGGASSTSPRRDSVTLSDLVGNIMTIQQQKSKLGFDQNSATMISSIDFEDSQTFSKKPQNSDHLETTNFESSSEMSDMFSRNVVKMQEDAMSEIQEINSKLPHRQSVFKKEGADGMARSSSSDGSEKASVERKRQGTVTSKVTFGPLKSEKDNEDSPMVDRSGGSKHSTFDLTQSNNENEPNDTTTPEDHIRSRMQSSVASNNIGNFRLDDEDLEESIEAQLDSLSMRSLARGITRASFRSNGSGQQQQQQLQRRMPTSVMMSHQEEEDTQTAIAILQKGAWFVKFGRRGKPHNKFVWLSLDAKFVFWADQSPNGKVEIKDSDLGTLFISDVQQIVRGRRTDVFKKHVKKGDDKDHLSFSLISADRTLDLEAFSEDVRDEWVVSIRQLIGNKD